MFTLPVLIKKLFFLTEYALSFSIGLSCNRFVTFDKKVFYVDRFFIVFVKSVSAV